MKLAISKDDYTIKYHIKKKTVDSLICYKYVYKKTPIYYKIVRGKLLEIIFLKWYPKSHDMF